MPWANKARVKAQFYMANMDLLTDWEALLRSDMVDYNFRVSPISRAVVGFKKETYRICQIDSH